MALENVGKNDHVKLHFTTREGKYRQMHLAESFYGKNLQYPAAQVSASSATPVKTSFVKVKNGDEDQDCICLTIGRELFYFLHKAIQQANQPLDFIDKRTYRGVAPTCHDINQFSARQESVRVAVGFTAGQVQIIDVRTKQSLHIMNEDRSVEKSRVTCVKWYPNKENLLLTSHINGFMYTYDVSQPCTNVSLSYQTQPLKFCDEFEVYVPKVKLNNNSSSSSTGGSNSLAPDTFNGTSSSSSSGTRNPLYKWIITKDGSAVNNFKFSPCGRYLAVVTQNGFLRVFDHEDFELIGSMKSYFGGLTACDWSPDGRFIATGGEDDLVTVWSFCEQCVVSRGTGHSSWITDLAFDPYCCEIPSDCDVKSFYELPSVAELTNMRVRAPPQNSKENNSLSSTLVNKLSLASSHQQHPNEGPSLLPNSNEATTPTSTQQRCNGDVGENSGGTNPPLTSMRRLRTYSNVSKLSRMSLGLDSSIPSLSYRFGSVGQDSQLCLWEIDQNVLACAREKRTTCATISNKAKSPDTASRTTPSDDNISEAGGANSSSASVSSGTSGAKSSKNELLEVNTSSTPLRSLSNPQLPNVKKKKNGWPSFGKFATLGSAERRNSRSAKTDKKEHKRNASLPYFGFRGTNNHNGGHKYGFHSKKSGPGKTTEIQIENTLGSELCPRIDETTMLEPLVCKKIAVGRLTGIDFKDDGIVTTCQDGFIQLWRRPMKLNEASSTALASDDGEGSASAASTSTLPTATTSPNSTVV